MRMDMQAQQYLCSQQAYSFTKCTLVERLRSNMACVAAVIFFCRDTRNQMSSKEHVA